jgi:RND family efflux transporter MFP subunit
MRIMSHTSTSRFSGIVMLTCLVLVLAGCSGPRQVNAGTMGHDLKEAPSVGVAAVSRKPILRQLTLSSELVPFQEIDVYAKEAGYVRDLRVDYGTHVTRGEVMAVLEIPELEVQIKQDEASIRNQEDMVMQAGHQLNRVQAQQSVYHLQYTRIKGVADTKPGLVADQEVDDAQGKDLAAQAQVEATKAALQSAKSELEAAKAKKERDMVLYDYSNITAPFNGVVTQRYANLGTLVQAGTSSSTNVLPIVKLSQDDKFRLVIPIPESYVKFVRIGAPVVVHVPSLDRNFPGKVTRFSVDISKDTRTMHTEVDVENPNHVLIPGMYADATIILEGKNDALAVPLQALNREDSQTTVFVVDDSNKIEGRRIQLGLQTANDAEVLSGLNRGERVIISDRAALKPGQSVKPHPVEMTEYKPQN